ncbi:MAG: hypothetical protein ACHQK8_08265 [Bacteroidia bacterium]
MPKFIICFISVFIFLRASAQENVFTVPLDKSGKDERFDKFMLTMPVFLTVNDSILSFDFESLVPSRKVRIKKPEGFNTYGYSYIFFSGNPNSFNPGFVSLLVAGVYDPRPNLFIDYNNNLDFTDDGKPLLLPRFKTDSLLIRLCRKDDSLACITIVLKRQDYTGQPALRKMMNDYYAFFYKDRQLAGIDFCYREQRYVTKYGTISVNGDSFRVALHDGNSNGIYNEPDSDQVISANIADTFFDSHSELCSFPISTKKMYVEYNDEQFEILDVDKEGRFIKLKHLSESLLIGKIKPGEKIPKFTYTTWEGETKKIKKLRKYDVLLYFTGPNVKNFSKDTALLRKIADAHPGKLKVILFMEINKSYEMKIFGTYSNLNYTAAFKDKEIARLLTIRGLPSSLWIGKRRRVIKYNVKPGDFLKEYELKYPLKK